jgi:hypothetical protein
MAARTDADPIDIVYLFGTGAVEGAWEPVLKAISQSQREAVLDRDLANWWFNVQGRIAHLASSWGALTYEGLEARFGPGQHDLVSEAMKQLAKSYRQQVSSLKVEIAREIALAQDRGDLRAREPFLTRVARDAGHGSTVILTANWDLSLERLLEALHGEPSKVHHLHGDIRDPAAMLLPGESPEELCREAIDNAKLTKAYFTAMGVLKRARRVYVAGLSLSPLDAALGVVLGVGLLGNPNPGEIIIVNKNKAETERIAGQVRIVVSAAWSLREMPLE